MRIDELVMVDLESEVKAAMAEATRIGTDEAAAAVAKKYVLSKRVDYHTWDRWACEVAGVPYKRRESAAPPKKASAKKVPDHGPGTELHKLTDALEIDEWEGCGCGSLLKQMNTLGVEGLEYGCRVVKDKKGVIVAGKDGKPKTQAGQLYKFAGILKDKAACVPRRKKWRAAWIVASKMPVGFALRMLWHGPYVGLVKEAIRRAEREAIGPALTATRTSPARTSWGSSIS